MNWLAVTLTGDSLAIVAFIISGLFIYGIAKITDHL